MHRNSTDHGVSQTDIRTVKAAERPFGGHDRYVAFALVRAGAGGAIKGIMVLPERAGWGEIPRVRAAAAALRRAHK